MRVCEGVCVSLAVLGVCWFCCFSIYVFGFIASGSLLRGINSLSQIYHKFLMECHGVIFEFANHGLVTEVELYVPLLDVTSYPSTSLKFPSLKPA